MRIPTNMKGSFCLCCPPPVGLPHFRRPHHPDKSERDARQLLTQSLHHHHHHCCTGGGGNIQKRTGGLHHPSRTWTKAQRTFGGSFFINSLHDESWWIVANMSKELWITAERGRPATLPVTMFALNIRRSGSSTGHQPGGAAPTDEPRIELNGFHYKRFCCEIELMCSATVHVSNLLVFQVVLVAVVCFLSLF